MDLSQSTHTPRDDVTAMENLREKRNTCRGRDVVIGFPAAFFILLGIGTYWRPARVALLLFQVSHMSVVVYRSSKAEKVKTVLRCVISSICLGFAQVVLAAHVKH